MYSCETALVKLIIDLLWNMKNSEVMAFVTIDLSAAFDTVDHRILLHVLQHDEAFNLLKKYLTESQIPQNPNLEKHMPCLQMSVSMLGHVF